MNINKHIILVMPPDCGVYKVIEENLKYMGFSRVTVLAPTFSYKLKDKVINFIQKTIFQNKQYKKQLIDSYYATTVRKALSGLAAGSVDYAIIIRPDKLDLKTIKLIQTVANKVVAYQWDGLTRFNKVFQTIPLFERFFVFDPSDYNHYKEQYPNILPCTNFYFNIPEDNSSPNEGEVLYVGVYLKDRIDSLLRIVNELSKYNNITFNITLFNGRKTPPLTHPHINFSSKGISFSQYLDIMKKAAILLDVKTTEHNGLSFRIFEALKYEKKLITDNKDIKQYDFYHPNNFYVVEDNNFEGFNEFLRSEYTPLAKEIKEKYSFSNWVKHALGFESGCK